MKIIKNMVTILFVLVCSFIIFTFVGIYVTETKDIAFSLPYKVRLNFKSAHLDYIGDSYGIYEKEDCSYYLLSVVMDNEINLGVDEQLVFLKYRMTDGSGYRIREVEQDGTEEILTEREYFPAGKQAVCFRILEIPEGCAEFDVVYGIYEEEEQIIHITI